MGKKMSPHELKMQRWLIWNSWSDEDCISEIEDDTNDEIFSEHNTDTAENDELDYSKNNDEFKRISEIWND